MNISIESEIGKLEGVIIHTPGKEVENMTPQNAERALYSDILNLSVAQHQYSQFLGVLNKLTNTFELKDLLVDVLKNEKAKIHLLNNMCFREGNQYLKQELVKLTPNELGTLLIEGVPVKKNNLTSFLSNERYTLQPLHNLFFTRDSSISIHNTALIGKFANSVRERESKIMEAIFSFHPQFKNNILDPYKSESINHDRITVEGGDIIVAREDIILIGIGMRTTSYGVDFIINHLKESKLRKHIIVQELPKNIESFIHLDMVFTMLDVDKCMVYKPVVLDQYNLRTVHILIDNGEAVFIEEKRNILEALNKLGLELKPIFCGGNTDEWVQEREQWHSGANFFAFSPGKIMGYGRNSYTIEELNKNGFEIIKANDILNGKTHPDNFSKCVIMIEGDELARGGGGCRCMTMPIKRKSIDP